MCLWLSRWISSINLLFLIICHNHIDYVTLLEFEQIGSSTVLPVCWRSLLMCLGTSFSIWNYKSSCGLTNLLEATDLLIVNCGIVICYVQDSQLAEKLSELKSGGTPWVGAFLLKKGKPRSDGSHLWPASEGGEDTDHQLRGEELFKSLHEYGTFAQVNLWNILLWQDEICILVVLKCHGLP